MPMGGREGEGMIKKLVFHRFVVVSSRFDFNIIFKISNPDLGKKIGSKYHSPNSIIIQHVHHIFRFTLTFGRCYE